MVAATREIDGLFVFHPRDVGFWLQVRVQLTLLAVVLLHLGVLAFDVFLLLMLLAARFHEVGHILSGGHGLFLVDNDIVGQLDFLSLGEGCLVGNYLFLVFLFFH